MMTRRFAAMLAALLALTLLTAAPLSAQQHTARRLGNPATRFAKPLRSPEDLRALLQSVEMKADVLSILNQSDWPGDYEDFRRAAAEAPIVEFKIPVGTRLPAMSSRENGTPVLLRDVLWAGDQPIDAYEFYFASKGQRYRVVTPKACSNFWIEDAGKEAMPTAPIPVPTPGLEVSKTAVPEARLCDPLEMKVAVRNSGGVRLTEVRVNETLGEGLKGPGEQATLVFEAGTLEPGERREFAFTVAAAGAGRYANRTEAYAAEGTRAQVDTALVVRVPVLKLACSVREQVLLGRPVKLCLTLSNAGDVAEPGVVVRVPIPAGATFESATAGGRVTEGLIVWEIAEVTPGADQELCAVFNHPEPAALSFTAAARSACAQPVEATCDTRIIGVPAILLEVIDLDDPIQVEGEIIYEIRVLNQGTAVGTNLRVRCQLDERQQFVSGSGITAVQAQDGLVTMEPLAELNPKATASWRVVVKAVRAGDARFEVEIASDQFAQAVREAEATQQY